MATNRRDFLKASSVGFLSVVVPSVKSPEKVKQTKNLKLGYTFLEGDFHIKIEFGKNTKEWIDIYVVSKEQAKNGDYDCLPNLRFVGSVAPGVVHGLYLESVENGDRLAYTHVEKPVELNVHQVEYQIEYGSQPVPYLE